MKTQCWVKIKLTKNGIIRKVISVTENTGVKQDGVTEWFRYDVLINYEQGDYPKNAAISFSGKKFENVLKLEADVKQEFILMFQDKYITVNLKIS